MKRAKKSGSSILDNQSIECQYAKKLNFSGAFASYYFSQKCYSFHYFTKFPFSLDMSSAETTKIKRNSISC